MTSSTYGERASSSSTTRGSGTTPTRRLPLSTSCDEDRAVLRRGPSLHRHRGRAHRRGQRSLHRHDPVPCGGRWRARDPWRVRSHAGVAPTTTRTLRSPSTWTCATWGRAAGSRCCSPNRRATSTPLGRVRRRRVHADDAAHRGHRAGPPTSVVVASTAGINCSKSPSTSRSSLAPYTPDSSSK